MVLILNLIFGILAFLLAEYILGRVKVSDPLKVVLALLVGLVVFLANLGSQVS